MPLNVRLLGELIKVKRCKGEWEEVWKENRSLRERRWKWRCMAGCEVQQRDTDLSIGEGQTEGKAVSLLLISTDRLTPQHPLWPPYAVYLLLFVLGSKGERPTWYMASTTVRSLSEQGFTRQLMRVLQKWDHYTVFPPQIKQTLLR